MNINAGIKITGMPIPSKVKPKGEKIFTILLKEENIEKRSGINFINPRNIWYRE